MRFPVFAYSGQMQLVLGVISYTTTFITMYMVAEIILAVYGEPMPRRQKAVFALITGVLLQSTWIYLVYFIGGRVAFDRARFLMVTSPNPITALLYYLVAIRVFRLPPGRSIKMMSYVYGYWLLNKTLNRLLGMMLFVQASPRYNYLLDAMQQLTNFALYMGISGIALHCIRKYHASLKFVEKGFFNKRRELFVYFLKALFGYAVVVVLPLVLSEQLAASVIINVILFLFYLCCVMRDIERYHRQVIGNQEVHISALFQGMEAFRGIKHDFFNILHTYSGYLELGAYDKLRAYHASLVETTTKAGGTLDLAHRTAENPALVSLLMNKVEYAERLRVKLVIELRCAIDEFFISNLEFCRVLACLLDNAIEAAAESEERRIYFTAEAKENGSKLVIITNSTGAPVDLEAIRVSGSTSKSGHSGIGLSTVYGALDKYGNCTFTMKYYSNEVSAYIELRKGA